jgi:indole-3-glycerol phosphate synthase
MAAIRGPGGDLARTIPVVPAVIAEIKRASPSRGWIRRDLDAVEAARKYLEGGAWAISILTEGRLFGGSLTDLARVRWEFPYAVLLRKDFLLDEYMLAESRAYGADMALLMVSVLGERTADMVALARKHRLEPLVEVHDEAEMAIAARRAPCSSGSTTGTSQRWRSTCPRPSGCFPSCRTARSRWWRAASPIRGR